MKRTLTTLLLSLLLCVGVVSASPMFDKSSVALQGEPESSIVTSGNHSG